ncbi:MAG: ABC transporter substrate-binding protein [Cyanobacteria bacterium]|nr:ABC transporter substrate-binding protein [Cyanobacteriota bacterium]MDW8201047.1 ABC transporter substrate-binding protein [Cyanobacteriota bacterium SKYGB_h_bin112]
MQRRHLLTSILLFLASIVLVVSCTNPASQIPTSTGTSPSPSTGGATVSLGFSAWPGWFPWQVAQEAQIFAQVNAKVDLKWFDGYLESINTLTAGQLSANSQTLNDTIGPIAAGSDLVIVLTNDNSAGNDQIIVREGINSIADLKGKKVAAEEGVVDHYLLLLGLQKEGLTQKDIEFVPLETGKAAAAFVAGQVDAVGVFAPFTTQALKRPGSKALFTSKDFPGAISDHLVFNRKFVDENPDQVQAVVNAWFATLDYMQANAEKATEIMAKRAGVSVDEYKEYAAGTKIFTIEDNLKALEPGNDNTSLPYSAAKITDFLLETGLIKTKPDLSKLFDDRFLKAYAAKAKTS